MSNIENFFKNLDKLEMLILKGLPIPLTDYVIIPTNSALNNLNLLKQEIDIDSEKISAILHQMELHIISANRFLVDDFIIVNTSTIFDALDKMRTIIPVEVQ